MKTFIHLILLAWLAFNLWRVFRATDNAIEVGADVVARCPRDFAFATYMKVREFYLQLQTS